MELIIQINNPNLELLYEKTKCKPAPRGRRRCGRIYGIWSSRRREMPRVLPNVTSKVINNSDGGKRRPAPRMGAGTFQEFVRLARQAS